MASDWIQCRPLVSKWPKPETPADARKYGPFKVRMEQLWHDLEAELARLGATQVLIEFDMPLANFRKLDTRPFADSRATTPRVLLRFVLPDVGEVQYPCDRYQHWDSNLRAISLTLTAQRAIQRYEALTQAEIYGGLKRLPPAGGTSEEVELTPDEAARALIDHDPGSAKLDLAQRDSLAATILAVPTVAKIIGLGAVKGTHPDTGGDPDRYRIVERARRVLDRHHGVAA